MISERFFCDSYKLIHLYYIGELLSDQTTIHNLTKHDKLPEIDLLYDEPIDFVSSIKYSRKFKLTPKPLEKKPLNTKNEEVLNQRDNRGCRNDSLLGTHIDAKQSTNQAGITNQNNCIPQFNQANQTVNNNYKDIYQPNPVTQRQAYDDQQLRFHHRKLPPQRTNSVGAFVPNQYAQRFNPQMNQFQPQFFNQPIAQQQYYNPSLSPQFSPAYNPLNQSPQISQPFRPEEAFDPSRRQKITINPQPRLFDPSNPSQNKAEPKQFLPLANLYSGAGMIGNMIFQKAGLREPTYAPPPLNSAAPQAVPFSQPSEIPFSPQNIPKQQFSPEQQISKENSLLISPAQDSYSPPPLPSVSNVPTQSPPQPETHHQKAKLSFEAPPPALNKVEDITPKMTEEDVDAAWQKLLLCSEKAVELGKSTFGVPDEYHRYLQGNQDILASFSAFYEQNRQNLHDKFPIDGLLIYAASQKIGNHQIFDDFVEKNKKMQGL